MPDFLNGGRAHKERRQPKQRAKFGLLEKKKDYVKRAKDFHRKEDAIRVLQEKASLKNPDEFYFAMQSAQVSTKGVHGGKAGAKRKRGQDTLDRKSELSKDLGYVTHKKMIETKRIAELEQGLHRIRGSEGEGQHPKHSLFMKSAEEAKQVKPEDLLFPGVQHYNCPPSHNAAILNEPKVSSLWLGPDFSKAKGKRARHLNKAMERAYEELQQRRVRELKLTELMVEIGGKGNVMGKGKKSVANMRKVKDDGVAPVYKWKKERKR
eukprot:TRINITY_DN5122_c0_g1_i3.p1 TRINITY_DN5122_c0_g1~~TRINITY_DN5122_c0_g1_i3.p1  ORF type:complete len:265 (-),score=58.31 TRINITY_DN5122_c0_g1_i3:174-968(-)